MGNFLESTNVSYIPTEDVHEGHQSVLAFKALMQELAAQKMDTAPVGLDSVEFV